MSPFGVSVYWNEEKEKRCTETNQQKTRWLDSVPESSDVNLSKLGVSEGQESLECYRPWGCKELDTTDRLKNNKTCRTASFKLHHFTITNRLKGKNLIMFLKQLQIQRQLAST